MKKAWIRILAVLFAAVMTVSCSGCGKEKAAPKEKRAGTVSSQTGSKTESADSPDGRDPAGLLVGRWKAEVDFAAGGRMKESGIDELVIGMQIKFGEQGLFSMSIDKKGAQKTLKKVCRESLDYFLQQNGMSKAAFEQQGVSYADAIASAVEEALADYESRYVIRGGYTTAEDRITVTDDNGTVCKEWTFSFEDIDTLCITENHDVFRFRRVA